MNARTREIAILSVVSASDADYPLGWHILDAAEAGLTPTEIQAIVSGDCHEVVDPAESSIVKFAREMALNAKVSDGTFAAVAAVMDEKQIVELSLLVGLYRLVSSFANALQVDTEDDPARALDHLRGKTS